MNKRNVFISLFLAISILIVQVGGVLAAPGPQASTPIKGILQKITLETDPSTAITTVILEVRKGNEVQIVRISQENALQLGFVGLDGDGKAVINERILGKHVEIGLTNILPPEEEKLHPVGDALAEFFSSYLGAEKDQVYTAIMAAHDEGVGFGAIAQVLWLTREISGGGNLDDFQALVAAKKSGIYTDLPFVDENGATITPKNWAELKNAILSGQSAVNLGSVMSNHKNDDKGDNPKNDHDDNKDKDKEKGNSGNGPNPEKEKKK
jgi:hypothetical protein